MSLTVNTKTYDEDSPLAGGKRYTGPAHNLNVLDMADLKRTLPKPTADSLGNLRGQLKATRSLTDGTNVLSSPALLDVQWRIPVEAQGTEIDTLIDDYAAFIASAAFKDLVKKQKITQ